MLAAAHRLRHSVDYRRTVRTGLRATRPSLVVHHLAGPSADGPGRGVGRPPRVGFIVGRDVGGAAVRNLVARRLRHLVRQRLGMLGADSCTVVRARPPAAVATSAQLESELDTALTQVVARATAAPLDGPRP